MNNCTIYIHPGEKCCNVYLIPFLMKPDQSPRDIHWKYQNEWECVALLNRNLETSWVHPKVLHLRNDIRGQMGGSFFEAFVDELFTN